MIGKIRGGNPCPARPDTSQIFTGLIGGVFGIGTIAWLTQLSGVPLLMAPFGATCVLLFAAPNAPLAQPRNVIGGHFIAALLGILALQFFGDSILSMAVAVGLTIVLMQFLRVVHPPAGANPLVIIMAGSTDYFFLVTPVLAGSIILIFVALLVNNVGANKRWPNYWL